MGKFNNTVVLKKGSQPAKGAPPPLALGTSIVAGNGVILSSLTIFSQKT